MGLKIVKARRKDTPRLARIFLSEFSKQDKNWTLRNARARVRQAMGNHPSLCFALYAGREIVGFMFAERFDFSKGKCIYLADIALKKGHQRKGCGKQALEFLISKAKRLGYKSIYLNSQKGAVKFYEKAGFRRTGYVHMGKGL